MSLALANLEAELDPNAEADPLANIVGTLDFGDMAELPPFASLAASLAFGSAALSVGLVTQPDLFEPLDLHFGLGDPLTQLDGFLQFDAMPNGYLSVVHSLASMTLSVALPRLVEDDILADDQTTEDDENSTKESAPSEPRQT